MLSPPGQPRRCGSCTLCCKLISVDELAKPEGTACAHCEPGQGCAIYCSRPRSCVDFLCQWLIQDEMPIGFRPDRIGVVLTALDAPLRLIAVCDEHDAEAWRREPIYSFLKRQARSTRIAPLTVLARAGRRLWLLTASSDIDAGEVAPGSVVQVATSEAGETTITVLPPDPP